MQITTSTYHTSQHMSEDSLLPQVIACPFCSRDDRREIAVIQENPRVALLRCDGCQAVSTSRMPTVDALDCYYKSWYQEPIYRETGEDITFQDSGRFGRHLAKFVSRYQTLRRFSILDFGGGDGTLAYSLAAQLISRGFEEVKILVVDYNDRTIQSKDSRIKVDRVANLDEVSGEYDLVVASAIIEHLTTPREYLHKLLELMKPGGCFYARTPYVVPLMHLFSLIGVTWNFVYPAHVHDLGQAFWEQHFQKLTGPFRWEILESKPSLVETTLSKNALRTVAAYAVKAPWYVLGRIYKLVGGWEIFVRKNPAS